MWKSWYDRYDAWPSVLDNLYHQVGLQMYQTCLGFNMLDMITTAQGNMMFTQYRAEFLLWSIMSSPLIFGATLPQLLSDSNIIKLITNQEIIAVNQDPNCVEGSLLRSQTYYDIWGKPLYDNSIIILMLNKSPANSINITLNVYGYDNDLYPALTSLSSGTFYVRDVVNNQDLGYFNNSISLNVNSMDAIMIKLIFDK